MFHQAKSWLVSLLILSFSNWPHLSIGLTFCCVAEYGIPSNKSWFGIPSVFILVHINLTFIDLSCHTIKVLLLVRRLIWQIYCNIFKLIGYLNSISRSIIQMYRKPKCINAVRADENVRLGSWNPLFCTFLLADKSIISQFFQWNHVVCDRNFTSFRFNDLYLNFEVCLITITVYFP